MHGKLLLTSLHVGLAEMIWVMPCPSWHPGFQVCNAWLATEMPDLPQEDSLSSGCCLPSQAVTAHLGQIWHQLHTQLRVNHVQSQDAITQCAALAETKCKILPCL